MKLEVVKSRKTIPQHPYELKLVRSECELFLMIGKLGIFNEANARDADASHLIFKMDFDSFTQLHSCIKKMSICCRQSCLEACHKAEQFLFPFENQK
jgi:hypothetical protein